MVMNFFFFFIPCRLKKDESPGGGSVRPEASRQREDGPGQSRPQAQTLARSPVWRAGRARRGGTHAVKSSVLLLEKCQRLKNLDMGPCHLGRDKIEEGNR
jgi:hypothetical protein